MTSVGRAEGGENRYDVASVQRRGVDVPKASLALRALADREALRATLRRAAGKLREVQIACAGLATVIEEVESTLAVTGAGG